MSSPHKKLKKDNEEDEKANKHADEKWIEDYNYFWSQEVQEDYHQGKKEWKAHVRKYREAGVNINEPILDIVSPYQMLNSLMIVSLKNNEAQFVMWCRRKTEEKEMRSRKKTGRRVLYVNL